MYIYSALKHTHCLPHSTIRYSVRYSIISIIYLYLYSCTSIKIWHYVCSFPFFFLCLIFWFGFCVLFFGFFSGFFVVRKHLKKIQQKTKENWGSYVKRACLPACLRTLGHPCGLYICINIYIVCNIYMCYIYVHRQHIFVRHFKHFFSICLFCIWDNLLCFPFSLTPDLAAVTAGSRGGEVASGGGEA